MRIRNALLALVLAGSQSIAAQQPAAAQTKIDQAEIDQAEIGLNTPARGFSYSLGLQTGANIMRQIPQAADDIDLEALVLGIRDRLRRRDSRLDVAELTFWSGKFMQMLEERSKAAAATNLDRGERFRAEYAAREGANKTDSGILYRELGAGSGRQPGIGQSVKLHVVGRTASGVVFDDSRKRGEPHDIKVRALRDGLQEAITLMPAGAVWEIVIPPELAYGESGQGDIGPNETLVYEVELLEIH